jgi:parallel beta-helix repeat protein
MVYVPINVQAYTAAYSGSVAGMAVNGWITSPTGSNYTLVCAIAGAFAEAFDVVWNNATELNFLEYSAVQSACAQEFSLRGPGPLNAPQFQDPDNWTIPARACATLALQADLYFAGQGITPPPFGGGGDVTSVFGRTGAVVAEAGDYGTDKITNESLLIGISLTETLNNIRFDVDIRDYGAVSGEDCVVAFNDAYDALPAEGGGIVVPGGNWGMSDELLVDKPRVVLVGRHGAKITKLGTDHHIFNLSNNASRCAVMGIEIDGNEEPQGSLILCRGQKNFIFDNHLHRNGLMSDGNYANQSHGVCLDGQTSTCTRNLVLGNLIEANHDIGVSENTAPNNRVISNDIAGNGLEAATIDVNSHGSQVTDNYITGNCIRGGVGSIGIDASDLWRVTGNKIEATQSNLSGIKTQNNVGPSNYGVITGNTILDNGGWGVWLFAGSSGNASNNVVTSNVVRGNTSGSVRLEAGCDNNVVCTNSLNGVAASNGGTGNTIANNT